MKTAMLIAGNARFCNEFDRQLASLKNSDIDIYAIFWNRNHTDDQYIPPSWNSAYAKGLIEPMLPSNVRLAHVEVLDPDVAPQPQKTYNEFYCNTAALWNQYWILQQCQQRLTDSKAEYDLVIRSRPDVSITASLDLQYIKNYLHQYPKEIVIPSNRGGGNFNDQFAIGLPYAISLYCQAIDHFDRVYTNKGTLWNPEWLMSQVIRDFGLHWGQYDFNTNLRNGPTDFGRWS